MGMEPSGAEEAEILLGTCRRVPPTRGTGSMKGDHHSPSLVRVWEGWAGSGQCYGWASWVLCSECLCPSKIHMLKPSPQGDAIRRWGLWEVTRSWGRGLHEWD